jgi:hypothetical protein
MCREILFFVTIYVWKSRTVTASRHTRTPWYKVLLLIMGLMVSYVSAKYEYAYVSNMCREILFFAKRYVWKVEGTRTAFFGGTRS